MLTYIQDIGEAAEVTFHIFNYKEITRFLKNTHAHHKHTHIHTVDSG